MCMKILGSFLRPSPEQVMWKNQESARKQREKTQGYTPANPLDGGPGTSGREYAFKAYRRAGSNPNDQYEDKGFFIHGERLFTVDRRSRSVTQEPIDRPQSGIFNEAQANEFAWEFEEMLFISRRIAGWFNRLTTS